VESANFLPTVQDGALIVYALLPGGSMFNQRPRALRRDGQPSHRQARQSAVLKGDNLFILSTEMAERATERSQYTRTTAQETKSSGIA